MADERARRAFIGFYNVVQSWSQTLYQQSARSGKVLQARRITTSSIMGASQSSSSPTRKHLPGMSILIDSPSSSTSSSPYSSFDIEPFRQKGISIPGARTDSNNQEIAQSTRTEKSKALNSLLSQIERGQIIEPMSTVMLSIMLLLQSGKLNQDNLSINQYQFDEMIKRLSNVGSSYGAMWENVQQKMPSSEIWRPSHLSSGEDLKTVPVQKLALFAAASLYDFANAVDILPSTNALAAILRLISYHVDLLSFAQCLSLILLQLSGVPFHEAQLQAKDGKMKYENLDCNAIPAGVIVSAIDGFGNLGRPELGEEVLSWWANSIPRRKKHLKDERARVTTPGWNGKPGTQVVITHWRKNEHIWTSLIRARRNVSDIVGARYWLQQFRVLNKVVNKSGKPFLEYLKCCASVKDLELRSCIDRLPTWVRDSPFGLQQALFRDGIQMMGQDQVPVKENLYGLVLNYQIGVADLESAARLLLEGQNLELVKSITPNIFKAIFRLHKRHAVKFSGESKPFDFCDPEELKRASIKVGPLNDLRGITLSFLSHDSFASKWDLLARIRALDFALEASLAVGDLPLAYIVQEVVTSLKSKFSPKTQSAAISWLEHCQSVYGGVRQKAYCPASTASHYSSSRSSSNQLKFYKLHGSVASDGSDDFVSTMTMPRVAHQYHHDRIQPEIGGLIRHTLLKSIRNSNQTSQAKNASWLLDVRSKAAALHEPTDEQLLRICAEQILLDKDGRNQIADLIHLL